MSSGVPIGAPFGLQLPVNDCQVTNRTGGDLTKGAIMRLAFEDFTESEATDTVSYTHLTLPTTPYV